MFGDVEAEEGSEPEDCVDKGGWEEKFGVVEEGESYVTYVLDW